MLNRRAIMKSAAVALALALAAPGAAKAAEPLNVVATFSILGDMTQRIGGKHVAVTTLVGPNGDAHVYQPTPADARAVSQADLLVVNGLEFEGWLDRLIDASDFKGARVTATAGVEAIALEDDDHHVDHEKDKDHAKHDDHEKHEGNDDHHHGAFDPHAWQSLTNALIYIDNITAALAKSDPDHATAYYRNRAAYVAEVQALEADIQKIVGGLPKDRRTIVTSHDAFQYFARDYGLSFVAPQGISTESEASAKDVAHLIDLIREKNIRAVFVENISDARLLKRIADETGAGIGGTLYPDALSGKDGPAATYLDMMRHNATTLADALSG